MILSSDEQKALHYIGGHLREQEPRLAAKFAIFTRLTAEEGQPPDEDLIRAIRLPMRTPARRTVRGFSAAARSRPPRARRPRERGRRRSLALVPAALLLLLILIITISLAKGTRCTTTTTRAAAVTGHVAPATCRQAGTAKTASDSR
jgi:hypothetical protein